jgi:hypothetical protein
VIPVLIILELLQNTLECVISDEESRIKDGFFTLLR